MDIQNKVKSISKMLKKHEKDFAELKKMMDEKRIPKKQAHGIINQMIVRTESLWARLRSLGRALDE